MHDATSSDHTTVRMWSLWTLFGTENEFYGIWINGHISIPWFYEHTALDSLETWRVFLLPCATLYTLRRNNFGRGPTLPAAKYTTFAYEMIRITKHCVTFNKYAKNFNLLNEMKTTITLPHTHAALCLSQLHETLDMSIYKMKSVKRKRCNLRYRYSRSCSSTNEVKLTPHNKTHIPR
jgi:hypothetical protein